MSNGGASTPNGSGGNDKLIAETSLTVVQEVERQTAATKRARASGSARPRGPKAWRSRKKPVSVKASATSAALAGSWSERRKSGSRISLSRYASPAARDTARPERGDT